MQMAFPRQTLTGKSRLIEEVEVTSPGFTDGSLTVMK